MPANKRTTTLIVTGGLLLVLFAAAVAYYLFGQRASHSPITARPNALMALPNEANTSSSRESDVVIPAEQLERLHLKIEPVTRHSIGAQIRVPGTVQPNAYQEVHVTPIVPGVVLKIFVQLGQIVKRGQPLAQLFSSDLAEAQTQLVSLETELETAHKKTPESRATGVARGGQPAGTRGNAIHA